MGCVDEIGVRVIPGLWRLFERLGDSFSRYVFECSILNCSIASDSPFHFFAGGLLKSLLDTCFGFCAYSLAFHIKIRVFREFQISLIGFC